MAKQSLFLSLPTELRARVYEAHFQDEQSVDVPAVWDEVRDLGLWRNQQPPITKVSRQIRAESLPIFYSFCTFNIWIICAPCVPSDFAQIHRIIRSSQGKACQCIPDTCYRREWSLSEQHTSQVCWQWLSSLGDANLAHLRNLVLSTSGFTDPRHIGYDVHVYQHPLSKRLTISPQTSFWKGGFDPYADTQAGKILGSEPKGQATIDEIHKVLEQDESSAEVRGPGLTLARIYKILDVSYQRTFGKIDINELLASERRP